MDRRLQRKLDVYIQGLKSDMRLWVESHGYMEVLGMKDLLNYMYEYDGFHLEKEDFQKRKRVKNVVPQFDRCSAKRASGEQCTRRRKEGSEYCGTHVKGTPHGEVEGHPQQPQPTKVEVFLQEIHGINYYIDKENNVYKTEDIISNAKNPNIVAKYVKNNKGEYTIPEFGLM
jgi:hypothetical protein